jgi:hypothetical protein
MDAAAKTISSVSAFAGFGIGKKERINKSGKRIENLKVFEAIILMASLLQLSINKEIIEALICFCNTVAIIGR